MRHIGRYHYIYSHDHYVYSCLWMRHLLSRWIMKLNWRLPSTNKVAKRNDQMTPRPKNSRGYFFRILTASQDPVGGARRNWKALYAIWKGHPGYDIDCKCRVFFVELNTFRPIRSIGGLWQARNQDFVQEGGNLVWAHLPKTKTSSDSVPIFWARANSILILFFL